jgi:serine/threonine-protein kinase 24/25/MST4
MSPRDEEDEWIFDTVKPSTMTPGRHTSKRRKLARVPSGNRTCEELMERLDLNATPLGTVTSTSPMVAKVRKVSSKRRSSAATSIRVPSGSTPTARRVSREQTAKKPLGLDLSFGNSPSTVRQFRRVSGEKENLNNQATNRRLAHSRSRSAINLSFSSSDTLLDNEQGHDENMPMIPADVPPTPASKESLLGRRAYSKILDPAFQETYAQTANEMKREAIAKVAAAWSGLNRIDPEGEFLMLKMMLERVSGDPKLASALGIQFAPQSPVKNTPTHAPAVKGISGVMATPDSPTRQKLMLAQNNPHLKSHRRRQSAIIGGMAGMGLEREKSGWDGIDERKLPGHVIPGLEHGGLLGDVLYGRWLEGLKSRWPLS